MSQLRIFRLCIIFTFTVLSQLQAQTLDLMTFNLRYSTPKDGLNSWDNRKDFVADLLLHYRPAVFGVQEALHSQMSYLDEALTDYTYVGVGRDDGKQKGEYSGIFYLESDFKRLSSGTFWLSETPNQISVGWDAALERICTYVQLESEANGTRFWVFNTHFDHRGPEARKQSARLILQKIEELNGEKLPVVLMGDLNLVPEEEAIVFISGKLADSWHHTQTPAYGPVGTFNGFDMQHPLDRRIDYIFVSSADIEVLKYRAIIDHRDQRYPSDHIPVMVRARFKD